MKKILKFTSNGVHVGISDYGFNWQIGDEHEVEVEVAERAIKTFPTLFTIVEKPKAKVVEPPKQVIPPKNKNFGLKIGKDK